VLRGGHATGTVISSGSYELVSSGGIAVATHISGGTLEVTSGGTASGVSFSGGDLMQLDSLLSQFVGVISGFDLGDEIGPRSLGFGSSFSTMPWMQETSGTDRSAPGVDKAHPARAVWRQFQSGRGRPRGTSITDPPASSSVAQTPLVAHH
jgi:autotransporter passenger strand-loop-strand repeat protein